MTGPLSPAPNPPQSPAVVGQPVSNDLDAIRARTDAATPGPWWAWDRGVGWVIALGQPDALGYPDAELPCGVRTDISRAEDAVFIAAARTDVPKLVAEVDRLRALVDQYEQAISWGAHCVRHGDLLTKLARADEQIASLGRDLAAVGHVAGERITSDSAWHSVWLHGRWRWLTRQMTTAERTAAADAVERMWARWEADDPDLTHSAETRAALRWWLAPSTIPAPDQGDQP